MFPDLLGLKKSDFIENRFEIKNKRPKKIKLFPN